MALFEVLFKRRRFLPIHQRAWEAITPHLAIGAGPEDERAHRLECFHYASVVYTSVYQAALAAGMSTSTGHSLARLHLGKYPFDGALCDAVDAAFSADPGSSERRWAEALKTRLERVVAAPATVADELAALREVFADLDFAATGLYPPIPA